MTARQMHGRADAAPNPAATHARPVGACAAAHSPPVSIPLDKQLCGPMEDAQPTDSEVFEFEERAWIMFERLSRAGLRVLDPETSTSLDHIVVAHKKKNLNLCGMRFSKSNPEGVLRSATVGIPIARTMYPLNESPTDARFLPLREGTDRAGLLDDNASPAAADVIAANDPLFVVDL